MLKNQKMSRKNFSLIELLIVIGIMGALAALILPAFSDSESAAKDTACDYNQAGTLRYLQMFRSANGVYPTGFHTGGSTATWAGTGAETDVELTTCATYNFSNTNASEDLALEGGNGENYAGSLINAGIVTLAYGQGDAAAFVELSNTAVTVKAVKECDEGATTWTEELDPLTGEVNPTGAPLTLRGVSLGHVAQIGQLDDMSTADTKCLQFRATDEPKFKIVPLYVAPTMDWEKYYVDGPNESKVSISMPGKCPWGSDGKARYYIAFFKVYEDGTPAKLLCTSCPDCGILDANAF